MITRRKYKSSAISGEKYTAFILVFISIIAMVSFVLAVSMFISVILKSGWKGGLKTRTLKIASIFFFANSARHCSQVLFIVCDLPMSEGPSVIQKLIVALLLVNYSALNVLVQSFTIRKSSFS